MKKFKRILLIAANALCIAGILVLVLAYASVRGSQLSQLACERWQGESDMRFAQVSVFAPGDAALSESGIRGFRATIDGQLTEAGIPAPESGSLWRDAYCAVGSASASADYGSTTAEAYGVGGDFFLFHPLLLLSGQYVMPDDLTNDRVVVNEMLAWKLYGGTDVAGMPVTVNGESCIIAGVVRAEDDFAAKHALDDAAMMLFMDYARLFPPEKETAGITDYELIMPNPLTGFAEQFTRNGLGGGNGVLTVENSARFSVSSIRQTISAFGERVMKQSAVVLPYWENAARYAETVLAGVLLLTALLCILPAITALWLLVKGWRLARKAVRSGAHRAGEAIENRREKRWERREALRLGTAETKPPEPETAAPGPGDPQPAADAQEGDMEDINRIVREILQEKNQ